MRGNGSTGGGVHRGMCGAELAPCLSAAWGSCGGAATSSTSEARRRCGCLEQRPNRNSQPAAAAQCFVAAEQRHSQDDVHGLVKGCCRAGPRGLSPPARRGSLPIALVGSCHRLHRLRQQHRTRVARLVFVGHRENLSQNSGGADGPQVPATEVRRESCFDPAPMCVDDRPSLPTQPVPHTVLGALCPSAQPAHPAISPPGRRCRK